MNTIEEHHAASAAAIAAHAEKQARKFLGALSSMMDKPFTVTSDHTDALARLLLEFATTAAAIALPPDVQRPGE